MTTRLILVGGFLGAGKTSLLWEAAQQLARQIFAEDLTDLSLAEQRWNCLQPGRPDSTYRYQQIVA